MFLDFKKETVPHTSRKTKSPFTQEMPTLQKFRLSLDVSTQMEMQQFISTSDFSCSEDTGGFDACVLQQSLSAATCRLPFQTDHPLLLPICQNPEEGQAAFQQFQLASARCRQRRKIKTEEKAKVVAAVWGTELNQFLAALDTFHQDDFEEKDEKNKGYLAEWML